MTNFKKLQSMSVEDLAQWFDKYIVFDNAPYMFWFDQKYCKNCEPIMLKSPDSSLRVPCAYCELEDTCRYFPEQKDAPDIQQIIKMWLEAEVEDES